jgi:chromosome partitioning protein
MLFALCRVGTSQLEITEARRYLAEAGFRVLAGELPEQVAYRRASDEGRAATETRYPSLNRRAERLAQSVVNSMAALTG